MASGDPFSNGRMGYRTPLLWLLLPLLIGYTLAEAFTGPTPILLALAGLMASILCISQRLPLKIWSALFLLAGTLLAWSWYSERQPPLLPDDQRPPREVELDLKIERTFARSQTSERVSGLGRIGTTPTHLKELSGKRIYFSLAIPDAMPTIIPSAVIAIRGVLSPLPRAVERTDFDHFLYRNGIRYRLTRGQILTLQNSGNAFYRFCAQQNQRFETFLRRGTPKDNSGLADIYVAMLLGKKSALSPPQKERFTTSGTLHFFAISGLHVGVIALSLHSLLRLLRIPEALAALLGLSLLFLYVQITGASPSAMRAFLMVAFFWSARAFLRQSSPFAALVASAVAVLIYDPRQLWSPGFQLSYAVVASILLYGLPLREKLTTMFLPFRDLPESSHQWYHRLRAQSLQTLILLFSVSLSATLISSPLSIAYFNTFSPGAIVLNMLLVALASLTLIGGFLSLLTGLLELTLLSTFINHSAWLLIWGMNAVVELALKVPGVFWNIRFELRFIAPCAVILTLTVFLIGHTRHWLQKPLFYLAPPVGLLILFVVATERV